LSTWQKADLGPLGSLASPSSSSDESMGREEPVATARSDLTCTGHPRGDDPERGCITLVWGQLLL